jgi:hypothetical protein
MLIVALLSVGLTGLVAPQAQARGVAECTNAELVASYHGGDAAMSHEYGWIVLKNKSDHTCATRGYGGLSYVGGGDGTQVGAAATRIKGPVEAILVAPGEQVRSRVVEVSYGVYGPHKCRKAHVDGFRVYVPDETHAQFVKHPTTGCRNHAVKLISHKAFRRP